MTNLSKNSPYPCLHLQDTYNPFAFLFKTKKINIDIDSKICLNMINTEFNRILIICLNLLKCMNTSFFKKNCGIQETVLELIPRLADSNRDKFNIFYVKDVITLLSELTNKTSVTNCNSKIAFCISSISLALSNTSNEFTSFCENFLHRYFLNIETKLKPDELNYIIACTTMFRKSLLAKLSLHKSFIMDSFEFFINTFTTQSCFYPSILAFLHEVSKFFLSLKLLFRFFVVELPGF